MNYEIPSWLQTEPIGRPGAALSRGVQAGSQIAHNFLQGRIASDENRRAEALMPLRQQQMESQLQDAALTVQVKQNEMADYLTNKTAFAKLAGASADISSLGAWANPESEKRIWEIAAENPSVVATPQFRNIIGQFDIAGASAIKARDAETRAKAAEDKYIISQNRLALAQENSDRLEDRKQAELEQKLFIEAERQRQLGERNDADNKTNLEAAKIRVEKKGVFDVEKRGALYRHQQEIKRLSKDTSLIPAKRQRLINEETSSFNETIKSLTESISEPDQPNDDDPLGILK